MNSSILPEIVEQHADDAAFLWRQRDVAVRSPVYDLRSLCQLDDRLQANLDGLSLAGEAGWRLCAEDPFVSMSLAVRRVDLGAMADIVASSTESRGKARAVVAALGFASVDNVVRTLRALFADDCPAEYRVFGIAGAAAHRRDPGPVLAEAAHAADLRLRARALRTVGELGRVDLVPVLLRAMGSSAEACQFWAAWSAGLLGEPTAGEVLWRIANAGAPLEATLPERACDLAARRADPRSSLWRLRALTGVPGRQRVALVGAAALGDPALLPWVIDCMTRPEDARLAGWVLAEVTGVDLRAQRLAGTPPSSFHAAPTDHPDDEHVAVDPDEHLPCPDEVAVRRWWAQQGPQFPVGTRFLRGRPMDIPWLEHVLRNECQPTRAAAALELRLRQPGRPLLDVRAPARRQMRALATSTPAT